MANMNHTPSFLEEGEGGNEYKSHLVSIQGGFGESGTLATWQPCESAKED